MINYINKIVDKFLTIRILKVGFFTLILLLLFFLIIVIPISLEKTTLKFSEIIAPIVISFSALLATCLAFMTLKTNEMNKELKENREDISEINYLLVTLNTILQKLEAYLKAVNQEQKVDIYLLKQYIECFSKYEDFFSNKTLMYYSSKYNDENIYLILNDMQKNLFFISLYNAECLENKKLESKNRLDFLFKSDSVKEHTNNLIEKCKLLDKALRKFNKNIRNQQYILYKKEKY